MLPEHALATDELDALLATLGSGPGLGLCDLLAHELRVLGVAQPLIGNEVHFVAYCPSCAGHRG